MPTCVYRYPTSVVLSPSSDTPSMADSLLDEEEEEEEATCEFNDSLTDNMNENKNDYGKVKTWRAVVHDCSNGEGAELTLYSPSTEKSQIKTTTNIPQQQQQKKLDENFVSASCLGTCLFQDTISEVTNMIQTASSSSPEESDESPSSNSYSDNNVDIQDDDVVDENCHPNVDKNTSKIGTNGDKNQTYYSWAALCGIDEDVHKQIMPSPQKLTRQKVRQNRSGNVTSRSLRLRNLQKNLRPFEGNELIEIDSKAISFRMDTSSSFIRSRTNHNTSSSFVPAHIASMTNNMMGSVQFCGETTDPKTIQKFVNDKLSSQHDDDVDRCYDSDPGDTKEYRNFRRRAARRAESRLRNRSRSNFDDSIFFGNSYDQFLEPEITHTMKEVMNTTLTLIWHRPQNGTFGETFPIAVHAWVEYGMRLRTALIQPKFMWKAIYDSKGNKNKAYNIGHENVHSIDLLDMTRILGVNKVDRERFPLANHSTSFQIEAYDTNFLFESKSVESKIRFVNGLKLAVARLGSRIIVGDHGVFDEFFETSSNDSFNANVPGEAPSLHFSHLSGDTH